MGATTKHLLLLLVLVVVLLPPAALGFECFTGDKDILRRKQCPSVGSIGFSDVCFKKIGDNPDDIQRGCFNKIIASLITEAGGTGCHMIPRKYGTGSICLCDTHLCNGGGAVTATTVAVVAAAAALANWMAGLI